MTISTRPSALPQPHGSAPAGRSSHPWWALTVLALAQFLVVLDASIVNIALPSVGSALHLDTAALAWVVTAYVLPFGGLLLLGGRLADRFGHRRIFLVGVTGFAVASLLAGLSLNGGMLLAARALQGGFAALLAPAALALLTLLFPDGGSRGRALGVWGAVAGMGSAAGVLLGGLLTASFGWPSVFFVNVPVGLLVVVTLPRLLARDQGTTGTKIDTAGAVTATLGLASAVAALSEGGALGWAHPVVIVLCIAAAALLAAFVIVERRVGHPLLPFGFFRNRDATAGNLVMLLVGGSTVALFFALSVYLQDVLGLDALGAGLSQLPLALALVAVAGVVPAVVTRIGLRRTLTGALLLLAASVTWFALAGRTGLLTGFILPSVLIGVALGATFVTATQLAVRGVSEAESGLASGLVNTSQQIGGALGLAVLGGIAAAQTAALLGSGSAPVEATAGGFQLLFFGVAGFAAIGAIVTAAVRSK
ncbi:DHA2 family efflux MFS transporter permease subunit [Leifsonia sp. ZF2019]|uniref:DHA2 family efflux MFS transporter permease subunit n=1 Tax=Leifsonia sp. ZF2019 TaxID=2781978 RepID=UPI001CBAE677|nr:DHA2 family efflux MFS transporter permease subunit [Leifsonia sp. ZF2019]UAJ78467.1 DHA2 family efflux MFS transporter permease subunit [Leifsonia sp. ZF2019]